MPCDRQAWAPRPRIVIDLDTDPATRVSRIPSPLIGASRRLLDAVLADVGSVDGIARLVDENTGGRFRGESEALGSLVGVDWQTIMVANASYDLVISSFACSTAAIASPGGAVLFRNMDWWPEHLLARASCLVEYRRDVGMAFESAGWAAASGVVTGMSGRGFAVALNAVAGDEPTDLDGYPVLLFLRCVLEDAESYGHAVQLLTDAHLASSALFIVVGRAPDERVVIERSPTRAATRQASGGEALVTTNDYRALRAGRTADGGQLGRTACTRFDTLTRLLRDAPSSADANDELLGALTHPGVVMSITAQHVIARPATANLELLVPTRLLGGETPGSSRERS